MVDYGVRGIYNPAADGELIGKVLAGFNVLPQSLKVIAGPEYKPESQRAWKPETEDR